MFNKIAPVITKRVRGECSPLQSAEIKSHMNIRNKLMRKARKSNVGAHREEYKRKRNEGNIMIRKAKSNYTRTLLSDNSRNPDGFWAVIKHVFPLKTKNVKSENLLVINGIKSTKPNEIANGFCSYFSTVVSTLKYISYPLIDFTWRKPLNQPIRTYKSFNFEYVSVIEVTQLLKKLKRKKVAGYDHPVYLKTKQLSFPLHLHAS